MVPANAPICGANRPHRAAAVRIGLSPVRTRAVAAAAHPQGVARALRARTVRCRVCRAADRTARSCAKPSSTGWSPPRAAPSMSRPMIGCALSSSSMSACWPSPDHANDTSTAGEIREHHRRQDGLQSRRPVAGRIRPQGDSPRRARDARPDGHPGRIRRGAAAQGRARHRVAAYDRSDRRSDRDPDRARRRGPLGVVQHLLHPGSRRRGDRRRTRGHARGSAGRPRLRLEGRDAGGVLVVHRAGAHLARRRGSQHDSRRRWRRHHARPQWCRVREGRCGAGPGQR